MKNYDGGSEIIKRVLYALKTAHGIIRIHPRTRVRTPIYNIIMMCTMYADGRVRECMTNKWTMK